MLLASKDCDLFNIIFLNINCASRISFRYYNETWPAATINVAVISLTDEAASVIKIPSPSQKVQDSFVIF